MTYLQKIEVGQKWRSRDPRDNGRTVEVIACAPTVNQPGNSGFVTVYRTRRSTMRATTLHRRYDLVTTHPTAARDGQTEEAGDE